MLPNRRRSAMDVKWSDCGWNDSRSPDPVPWSDVTYKALNVRELWEGLTLRRLAAFADPGLGVLPRRAWNPGHPGVTPSPGGTLPIIAFQKRKVPYLASVLNRTRFIATARGMPTANVDAQSVASIDAILGDSTPSGFISVGTASSGSTLGVTARTLEEMDEGQLTTQVCSGLVCSLEV